MFDFEEALKLIAQQSVLCVGDLMLDDFVYGEVERISPEAPTPVLAVRHSEIGHFLRRLKPLLRFLCHHRLDNGNNTGRQIGPDRRQPPWRP